MQVAVLHRTAPPRHAPPPPAAAAVTASALVPVLVVCWCDSKQDRDPLAYAKCKGNDVFRACAQIQMELETDNAGPLKIFVQAEDTDNPSEPPLT